MPATARPLAPSPPVDVVAERVAAVRARIAATGRDPAEVRLVAVTKGFASDAVRAALAAGIHDIGENYADELMAKAADVGAGEGPPVRWHFLGAIQRRRVARLAPVVSWWQTLSREAEAVAIAARAPGATVLVEVDVTGIAGRNGVALADVAALVAAAAARGLDVRGLMVVGPPGPPEGARAGFRRVAALARELGLREVSMGMSDDLDVALSEGSTMVRVGRALFGARPPAAP